MEPVASLAEDHRIIERMVPALARMADQFAAGEFVRGYDFARVLEFLREFVDAYHQGKEERGLFPALEARGVPRDDGLILELLREHEEMGRCVGVMTAAMSEAIGEDPGAESDFAESAREYIALLRRHIEREDSELPVLADETLTAEDGARLAEAYAELERKTIGEGGRERFREMAEGL